MATRLTSLVFRRRFLGAVQPGMRFQSTATTTATEQAKAKASEAAVKGKAKAGKLKELAKKYGASGVIVYLGVGMVDLGVTLGAIQIAGLDQVQRLEQGVMDVYRQGKARVFNTPVEPTPEVQHVREPSFATVFLLAYGIHKTVLMPVRLAITAAITPAFVRKIHALGWAKYAPRLFPAPKPTSASIAKP